MERRTYSFELTDKLGKRAKHLIPAGAHTYSKGDDQFPANAPKIITRGKGCQVWDADDNCFLDMAMSLGSVFLGHAYEPVLAAVRKEIENGVNFTRPSHLEGDLAEIICDIIPCAEMVKFGKHGSDATTAAVKLARAYTGRDYVARCEEDPFNSVHDWFIGSTVVNRGIPQRVRDLTLKFRYNDIDNLKNLFAEYPGKIACVLLEPVSFIPPAPGYLESLKSVCEANGALLIFDEVVSGFRFALGGVQEWMNVKPHLAAFGKAMANGFSISALVGGKEFMKLGGTEHDSERVFLLSTTNGGETHCFAAAMATIKAFREHQVIKHIWSLGSLFQNGFRTLGKDLQLDKYFDVIGYPCRIGLVFKDQSGAASAAVRTLFMQEMAARGILIPYINSTFAHNETHLKQTMEAAHEALIVVQRALAEDAVEKYLEGPAVKPVFRKFNK